nr:helix-turn-helix domain-containing protein [Micromonospora sp. DSM 115978]
MSTPDASLGLRLARARGRRRMSQAQLAAVSGVSVGSIRKLEQQQRHSARLDTVAALAAALDVPMSDLLGVEPGVGAPGVADIASLRTAIHDRSAGVDPPLLSQLRAGVCELRTLYWSARYAAIARQIPAQLAGARSAVEAATGADARRAANDVLAESLNITASLVTHLAYEDLAHVALLQAIRAAEQAEDPLLIAAQHCTTAWVLSRQGLWDQAQRLALDAAARIEPVLSRARPEQVGMWGALLHFGLVALAREGRTAEAHDLLRMVQAAGHALGDQAPSTRYGLRFSRVFSAHSAVQLAQATDQPRDTLRAAERVDRPETLPPSVRARYLLNVAWACTLEWRSLAALDALRQVATLTPELMQHHGLARSIVEELLPRRRTQRLPGLVGLAEQVGVVGR